MPNSVTYARLEKECGEQIKKLSVSQNRFDDPLDSLMVARGTGVSTKVASFKDDGVTEIIGTKAAIGAIQKECRTRFDACRRFEADLARYEQECVAHRAATDAFVSAQRQHEASKSTGPGPTPPAGLRAAPVPPPYWSKA